MMLSELKTGDSVEWLDVLIEKRIDAKTKSDKPYLRLTIRDTGSSLEAVLWDYDDTRHNFPEGSVVKVLGQAGSYNGAVQLTLKNLMASDRTIEEFAKATKFDVSALWEDLVERVNDMTEPLTKFVAEEILLGEAFAAAFRKAPAAKGVHNAWYGGLLEHVWSLCQMADAVVAHYQKHYEPRISKDKVIFGLMIHDAGKVLEYDFKTPAFSYTAIGQLTPHIVLGPAWVYEKSNKWWASRSHEGSFSKDEFQLERAHLMHLLVSHHGRVEWGSAVPPSSLEAILVHQLDLLDSRVLHALDFVGGKPGQIAGFSERSPFERVSYLQYK